MIILFPYLVRDAGVESVEAGDDVGHVEEGPPVLHDLVEGVVSEQLQHVPADKDVSSTNYLLMTATCPRSRPRPCPCSAPPCPPRCPTWSAAWTTINILDNVFTTPLIPIPIPLFCILYCVLMSAVPHLNSLADSMSLCSSVSSWSDLCMQLSSAV